MEVIQEAQKRGVKFAIATGRAYEGVKSILDDYGLYHVRVLFLTEDITGKQMNRFWKSGV